MGHCDEVSPITQAINRIIAAGIEGASHTVMERETETIVREWQDERDIDHVEFNWRLTTLRDELANGINAFDKHLPLSAGLTPSAFAKMREMQKGLINAKGTVCRLHAQTLA